MALDITNTTYGRDESTVNKMIETANSYFNNIRSTLTGQEKQEYISAVQNSWSGADSTAYIKKVEYIVAQIDEYIAKLPSILENAIREDYSQFQSFQNKNAEEFN